MKEITSFVFAVFVFVSFNSFAEVGYEWADYKAPATNIPSQVTLAELKEEVLGDAMESAFIFIKDQNDLKLIRQELSDKFDELISRRWETKYKGYPANAADRFTKDILSYRDDICEVRTDCPKFDYQYFSYEGW